MGSADKMIFYAKEMLSELGFKPLKTLNPFLVCKLDLPTINCFQFEKIPKELNKYAKEQNGVQGLQYLLELEKKMIFGVQKSKIESGNFAS